MTKPTAADRAAMEDIAANESAAWCLRRGALRLTLGGRSLAVVWRSLRQPAPGRDTSPPRLRFDRVAQRVCAELRAAGPSLLPDGCLGFVAIRAPIRVAAKTVTAIKASLDGALPRRPRAVTTLGNHVRLGVLPMRSRGRAGIASFIHTHEIDAARLQQMTEDMLALRVKSARHSRPTCLVLRTPTDSAWLGAYRYVYTQLVDPPPYHPVFMAFCDGKSGRLAD